MAATYSTKSMIRGFHVYQSVWSPITGEELPCVRELSNAADPFAVAVVKNATVVGHIPRKISSVCSMFLRKGGSLTCQVLSLRRYSADLPQGGLEVPCLLKFCGERKDVNIVEKLIKLANEKIPEKPPLKSEVEKCTKSIEMPTKSADGAPNSEEPAKKKRRVSQVSEKDIEEIEKGERLSDIHMEYAQMLLKHQFPLLNGLKSPLYQYQELDVKPGKDHLQILHSRNNHWIVASTVEDDTTVAVYDSLYDTLDEATKNTIANLFLPSTVKVLISQKQSGGQDCGLFAIANATTIAYGANPSLVKLDQHVMRSHLSQCFKNKHMSLFPTISQLSK